MGWKDTVKPIEPSGGGKASWRDTVKPVQQEEPKGLLRQAGETALGGLVKVGQAIDSVTGAPTRSAISSLQKGEGLVEAAKSFGSQFAADPELAPTGKDIAAKAGLSTKGFMFRPPIPMPTKSIETVSPAGIAGLGIDIAADPTNFIPGSAILKGTARAGKTALGATGKAALKAGEVALTPVKDTAVVAAAKNTYEGAKVALDKLFNPKVADDFKDLSAIAAKNNIDPKVLPESIEFGDNSLISRVSRQKREGILGEQSLDKFQDSLSEVRNATDRKIAEIGRGAVLGPVEAGNFIRKGYDEAFDEFFSTVDTSYNQVINSYPGLKVSESAAAELNSALNGIEKFAKGRVMRGVTQLQESQGRRLLKSVQAIRATNGSVKQTVEALRDIGEAAFKSQNTLAAIPADVQRMRKLYGDITEAIHKTLQESVPGGAEVSNSLRANNARMSEFFGDKSALEKVIGNGNLAPENVFKSLVLSGDTRKIEALRNILGPERMQVLKASTLDALIKRTDEMDFNFRQLRNAIRNKKEVLSNLLDPSEAQDFADLVRLGDRFGQPILSTSGTGASNVLRDIRGGIENAVLNDTVVESMKKRARGGLTLPPKPIENLPQVNKSTKIDKAAKGLQIMGAQSQNDDKRKKDALKRRLGE